MNGSQFGAKIVPDDSGGAYVVWSDNRDDNYDVYAQRYDENGQALWAAGGVPVCAEPDDQWLPEVCTDGLGGAFIVWFDVRPSVGADIYAQRIDGNGSLQWATGGVPVCAADGHQHSSQIAYDGHGSMIVAWVDERNANDEIRVQRVNANGATLWGSDAVAGSPGGDLRNHKLVILPNALAASTRIVVAYDDYQSQEFDTYAQRLSLDGVVQWVGDGLLVNDGVGTDQLRDMIDSGTDGTILAWSYSSSGTFHMLLQRLDSAGSPLWGSGRIDAGIITDYEESAPTIASDGAGGCYGTGGAVAVHVDAAGVLTTFADLIDEPGISASDGRIVMLADGHPAVLFAKDDGVSSWIEKHHLQKIDPATGDRLWGDGGIGLSSLNIDEEGGELLAIGENVWAVWSDTRTGNYDVYLQLADSVYGFWAEAEPVIESVADVPQDEGGWVRLTANASGWDLPEAPYPVTDYGLWRRISVEKSMTEVIFRSDDPRLGLLGEEGMSVGLRVAGAAARLLGLPDGAWESLGLHPAMELTEYTFLVPTRTDSVSAALPWEVYSVSAHTNSPSTYFSSEPDSGFSVDNLAPGVLTGLAGAASHAPEGLDLTWNESGASDLAGYRVHRGIDQAFIPAPANQVASPTDAEWFDPEWTEGSTSVYKVAAVDRHGNRGEYAALAPGDLSGIHSGPGARARLEQNSPNPFNPWTSIEFEMSEQVAVSLRIFDVAGRIARTLINGEVYGQGRHQAIWNGRDDAGRQMSSGTYFYRLEAGKYQETKRMVLVK